MSKSTTFLNKQRSQQQIYPTKQKNRLWGGLFLMISRECSNGQDILRFQLCQVVNLFDVFVCKFLNFFLQEFRLVLGDGVLFEFLGFVVGTATDVADAYLGILSGGLGALDELAAAFLSQRGDGDTQQLAVVHRVESQVGVEDGLGDIA